MWIRNNLSTWGSQIIDTVLFVGIAFYGLFPIGELIIGGILVKIGVAMIDTPFLYLIRWFYEKTVVGKNNRWDALCPSVYFKHFSSSLFSFFFDILSSLQ